MTRLASLKRRPTRAVAPRQFPAIAAVLVVVLSLAAPARAADLTPREQDLLAELDGKTIAQAIELAAQVTMWRKQLADRKAATEDDAELFAVVESIAKALQQAGAASPKLGQVIAHQQRIGRVLKQAEQEWQSAPYDANSGLSEQQFRDQLKRRVRAAAASKLIDVYESEVFPDVEQLRNPAEFAKRFLETEITAWLKEPREAGGVTFRILEVNSDKSLFADEANAALIIEHQEGISVTAKGLYFRYRPGQPPEPQFDKIEVDQSLLASLGGTTLKSLGDAIPGDFGLPIEIKNVRFNGFNAAGGLLPGSISFDVEIGGLLEFAETLKLAAEGVTIDSRGRVAVKDGFTFEDQTTKVPIGTSGLIFDGYAVTLRPEQPQTAVTLRTHIAAASGKQSLALDVSAMFGFPANKILYEGSLVVGGSQKVGKVEGEIGPQRVSGRLRIPEGSTLPLDQIIEADVGFELDQVALTADGDVRVFGGAYRSAMDLALRFDGSGHFTGSDGFRIAGAEVDTNLLVRVQEEFRRLDLEALLTIGVDLKLFRTDACVEVKAASNGEIHVVARAVGAEAAFTVPTLAALTPDRIAAELIKQLPDMLENLAAAAAQWEKEKKELLASWESHWRETLHSEAKKYGLDSIDTGDERTNRLLGDVAREGKQGGKWVKDVWDKGGGEASSFVQNPAEKLKDLPSNAGKELENFASSVQSGLTNALFGKKQDDGPSGPSPAEQRAGALHKQVEESLAPVVAAANRIHVHQTGDTQRRSSEDRFVADDSELHLRFDNAAAASEGEGSGTLGLTVSAAGFRSRIRLGGQDTVDRQVGSDVKAAWIEFRPLVPKDAKDLKEGEEPAKPSARIFVDSLDDPSGLGATQLARLKLQQLVELYLPEVAIEGPQQFVESRLAVHNQSSERITVWVLARRRSVRDGQYHWSWSPAGPGDTGAFTETLEPGEKRVIEAVDPATETSSPLSASRVRIWAESESGERWTDFQEQDLYLVGPNDDLGGARAYIADSMKTYTHVIKPSNRRRIFQERQLVLENDSPEEITVRLRYATSAQDSIRWHTLPELTLAPGATVEPRGADGMRVRASRIRFTAESEHLQFIKYRDRSLYLVTKTDDRRIYHATQIGTYKYAFTASADHNAER